MNISSEAELDTSIGSGGSDSSSSVSQFPLNDKNLGRKIKKYKEELASGSFGRIYRASDENDNFFAIKEIKIDDSGIPCLLEAAIMSTIRHPYINRSIKTLLNPGVLLIFQELAISDLAHFTRSEIIFGAKKITSEERRIQKPSLFHSINQEILFSWIQSLLQAVNCLHSYNIIHCDIKAANILLYSDYSIKLTDFTLSSVGRASPDSFDATSSSQFFVSRSKMICTGTHRPLEVFLNENIDSSVDIWSIGCTIYEIVYGCLIFQMQDKKKKKSTAAPASEERLFRTRLICALLDFGRDTNQIEKIPKNFLDCVRVSNPIEKFEYYRALRGETSYYTNVNFLNNTGVKDYYSYNWNPKPCDLYQLNETENNKIINLILRCLRFDLNERPSCLALLEDSVFNGPELNNLSGSTGHLAALAGFTDPLSSRSVSPPKIDGKKLLPSAVLASSPKNLNKTHVSRVVKIARDYYGDQEIIKLENKHIQEILNIYSRCYDLGGIQEELKVISCCFIVFKLLTDKAVFPKTLLYKIHDILDVERKICNFLRFQIFIQP